MSIFPVEGMGAGEFKKRLSRWIALQEIDAMKKTALWVICDHINMNDGSWGLSRGQIAAQIRRERGWKPSEATVKRYLAFFRQHGLIETTQTYYRNKNGRMVWGKNRISIIPTFVIMQDGKQEPHDIFAVLDDEVEGDPRLTHGRPTVDPRNDPRSDPRLTHITSTRTRNDKLETCLPTSPSTCTPPSGGQGREGVGEKPDKEYYPPSSVFALNLRSGIETKFLVEEFGLDEVSRALYGLSSEYAESDRDLPWRAWFGSQKEAESRLRRILNEVEVVNDLSHH